MQQTQTQNFHDPRLSTSSHSSLSAATNALLNGLLPSHRFSQISTNAPALAANLTPNQLQALQKRNNQLKRSEKIKQASLTLSLALILALLLIVTIELASKLVKIQPDSISSKLSKKISNLTTTNNQTSLKKEKQYPIRAFFTCVWIFNSLLFINCFIVHTIAIQRRSRRGRTTAIFLREFGRVFDKGKSSSNNTLVDCLIKTCLLCFLWYLTCYLIIRSMTILISVEIIILYSITVTSRQLLGWIFLHEQFIGNKVIAYIVALSALLFLAHDDGFRFNTFLLGLSMVGCAVGLKTTFDILVNSFIEDLTNTKLRIVMINVCFCGTCLLWPLALLLHFTQVEQFEYKHIRWLLTTITLICGLTFNILTIVIPFKYSSMANAACLLFVIPSASIIDRYLLNINYSPLVISAILCSSAGVLLSMIPKEWFQVSETTKMKQAFGLLNKDSNTNTATMGTGGTATGTSSAFEEIRAQRRIRNALLYNEVKT
ncbi:unnamed protein product [Rotaria sp. Silwood2]|nr:unnamed protein product [Rotaria sp. Silwood2]CAF3023068.1 unnamed protein product [Rotaria sp. Silwood2]CAF3404718.1 unnamed protein product [Rotaria sp. Silwood2]CAF4397390.1 unnamed protein product [Rotaria sp. Silwood2]CAF4470222.1 unnamed protein product [Rotaria sp. Silwood2]